MPRHYGIVKLVKGNISKVYPYNDQGLVVLIILNNDYLNAIYYEVQPRKAYEINDVASMRQIDPQQYNVNYNLIINHNPWGPYLTTKNIINITVDDIIIPVQKIKTIGWPSGASTAANTLSSLNIRPYNTHIFWSHPQHVVIVSIPGNLQLSFYQLDQRQLHSFIVEDTELTQAKIYSAPGSKILYVSPRSYHYQDFNNAYHHYSMTNYPVQSNLNIFFSVTHQGQMYNYSVGTHFFRPVILSRSGRLLVFELSGRDTDWVNSCIFDTQTRQVIAWFDKTVSIISINNEDHLIYLDTAINIYLVKMDVLRGQQIISRIELTDKAVLDYQVVTDQQQQVLFYWIRPIDPQSPFGSYKVSFIYVNFNTGAILVTEYDYLFLGNYKVLITSAGIIYIYSDSNNILIDMFYVGPITIDLLDYAADEQLQAFNDMRNDSATSRFKQLPVELQEQVIQNLFPAF